MADWQYSDYALRGEYCPSKDIKAFLDLCGQQHGWNLYVHLALDHQIILKSLTWAGADSEYTYTAQVLSDWLRRAEYKVQVNKSINREIVQRHHQDYVTPISPVSRETVSILISQLCAVEVGDQLLPLEVSQCILSMAWTGCALSHTGKIGAKPKDGEVRSVILVASTATPWETVFRNDGLTAKLGVMLKCTAEANARRDSVVMDRVRGQLWPLKGSSNRPSYEDVATQALQVACDITGSVAGAVYMHDAQNLVNVKKQASIEASDHAFPDEVGHSQSNSVGWSIARHRAWQEIDGSSATTLATRVVRAAGGSELVTPIPGTLANIADPAVGAMVLYSQEPRPRGYNSYERAIVRNLCLRLATVRSSLATREIADAIAELRRLFAVEGVEVGVSLIG